MISLVYSEVPLYLHESEFYLALNTDDPHASFEIPAQCYRESDQHIDTVQDLENILCVMTFWGLKSFPISVLEFCSSHNFTDWESAVPDEKDELRILRAIFDSPTRFTLQVALETEIVEFVTFWLIKSKPSDHSGEDAIAQACQFGRLDLVQTLHERGFPWHGEAYTRAAELGHLDILKYLHNNGCIPYHGALLSAIGNKHVRCTEYLLSIGCPCDERAAHAAAQYGYLSILQRLHEELGCPWDTRATTAAAEYGHLDCLQYLHVNGCPWDETAIKWAAQYGHLQCLQYLHENGCPWDKEVTECALLNNDVYCLQYVLENGCPFVDWRLLLRTLSRADHLTSLQYLVEEQSFELSTGLFAEAFIRGHVEQVRYLIDVGCPFQSYVYNKPNGLWYDVSDETFLQCIEYAVTHGWQYNMDLVEFIQENSLPLCQAYIEDEGWRAALTEFNDAVQNTRSCCIWYNHLCPLSASDKHFHCLCSIVDSCNCIYDGNMLLQIAAGTDNIDCLKLLIDDYLSTMTTTLFEAAFIRGNFICVEYLLDDGCPIQDYVFQEPTQPFPIPPDEGLMQCISYTVEYADWKCNTALLNYINTNDLPLCQAYIRDDYTFPIL